MITDRVLTFITKIIYDHGYRSCAAGKGGGSHGHSHRREQEMEDHAAAGEDGTITLNHSHGDHQGRPK